MTTRFSSGDTLGLPLVVDFVHALADGSVRADDGTIDSSLTEGMYLIIDMLLPSPDVTVDRMQSPDITSSIKAFIHSSEDTFICFLTASNINGFPSFFILSTFNTSFSVTIASFPYGFICHYKKQI